MLRLSFKIIAGEQASNDGATCSLDLRQRVADALAGGMTVRAAALRFGISAATAVRIGQRERSGRGLAPAKMGGHVKPMLRGAAADEGWRPSLIGWCGRLPPIWVASTNATDEFPGRSEILCCTAVPPCFS
ncbi:hypothetical protein [Sinorhizobium medicae]|uniref:hypothetical protein n=1 Tax=Sinorhizobium medicae TaxID=110321 RepID=UPI001F3B7300|nr:hypothetical protein [Sinorhizobium medicae]WQP38069.1 hypothetical protein U8C38_19470 [Sinorhizobium medicae]